MFRSAFRPRRGAGPSELIGVELALLDLIRGSWEERGGGIGEGLSRGEDDGSHPPRGQTYQIVSVSAYFKNSSMASFLVTSSPNPSIDLAARDVCDMSSSATCKRQREGCMSDLFHCGDGS